MATKDAGAAESALGRFRDDDPDATYTDRSYDGVDYAVDAERVANGVIDDFVVIGTEDAFKRTADMRDDGDEPGRRRPLQERGGRPRRREPRPLLHRSAAGVRGRAQAGPVHRRAARAVQVGRSRSTSSGRSPARSRPTGTGMSLDTVLTGVPEGPFRDLAKLWSGSEVELLAGLPGDAWGALADPGARQGGGVDAQLVRRRDRRRGRRRRRSSRRPGSTSRRTSSRGSATSAASSAARTRPRSTARSSSRRRTTPGPRRRSAS